MRRLNFLEDEPWDEVEDDKRARWFGHPFGTDRLGASLIEYLPQAPGGPMHMHYGVEEMVLRPQWDADRPHARGRGGVITRRRRLLPGRPGRAAHLLERHGRACEDAWHLDQAVPRCPRLPGAGSCLGGDPPS